MKYPGHCQLSESSSFVLTDLGFVVHYTKAVTKEAAKILRDITGSCTKVCVLPPTTMIA